LLKVRKYLAKMRKVRPILIDMTENGREVLMMRKIDTTESIIMVDTAEEATEVIEVVIEAAKEAAEVAEEATEAEEVDNSKIQMLMMRDSQLLRRELTSQREAVEEAIEAEEVAEVATEEEEMVIDHTLKVVTEEEEDHPEEVEEKSEEKISLPLLSQQSQPKNDVLS
jgi:hypothetical protein